MPTALTAYASSNVPITIAQWAGQINRIGYTALRDTEERTWYENPTDLDDLISHGFIVVQKWDGT